MEPTKKELTLEESIKQVMKTLPPVIRAYLAQGTYSVVAQNLMKKYSLRIDQGGVLEREIMLLLMGIENPEEFTQTLLEEAKLDQSVVNSIVQDINTQIFMPLRAEEMKVSQPAATAPVLPSAPPGIPRLVVPLASPKATQGTATAPTPPQPEKFFHLQNKIPAPASSSKPIVATPRPANPGLRGVLAAVAKPADASRMLEDHEEPHIEFKKTVAPLPPPANLPGAMPPVAVPRVAAPSTPIQPRPVAPGARFMPNVPSRAVAPAVHQMPGSPIATTAPIPPAPVQQKPIAPPAPVKPYSADPYREPIE
jgi:hypothetical protein